MAEIGCCHKAEAKLAAGSALNPARNEDRGSPFHAHTISIIHAPVSASPVSVLDLNSLVHVPVIVGPECETEDVVTVEALPI